MKNNRAGISETSCENESDQLNFSSVMKNYDDNEKNKTDILEDRKEFYKDNKEHILEERAEHYKKNYKTKISAHRKKKEECECGMTVCHYYMKNHKKSQRHLTLMNKISI